MATEEDIDELVLKLASYDPFALRGKGDDRTLPVDPNLPKKRPSFPQPSSMGDLDALPLELLHHLLEQCDLLSVTRVARTCKRGREAVESLQPYRTALNHAYPAMNLLGQLHLAGCHTISDIYAALCSQHCVNCGNFCAFIFAPTLDRVCFCCTRSNQMFWLLPADRLCNLFGLSFEQIHTIPAIYSFPGNSLVNYKRVWLRPVNKTRDLALKIHGSRENILRNIEENWHADHIEFARHLVEGSIPSASIFPDHPAKIFDRFWMMGSMVLPCLMPDHTIETGVWCKGCQNSWRRRTLVHKDEEVEAMSPPGVSTYRTTFFWGNTARTMADFREHVQTCLTAKRLLNEWEEKERSENSTT